MFTRLIVITLLLATACTPGPMQSSPQPQDLLVDATNPPENKEATATPSPEVDGELQKKLTQIVVDDLAARLKKDTGAISVLSAEALVWPDAALGCPLPGKVYAQGTVPGFRVRLEAGDKEYSYHTDRTGQFILCAPDPTLQSDPSFPVPPGEIDDGKPWMPVN